MSGQPQPGVFDQAAGLSALSGVLAYPDGGYWTRFADACQAVGPVDPEAARLLAEFAEEVRALTLEEHEELYTRTFDVNPVTSLEIGWQLFGEDYHRGELLVRLRRELRRHGVEETSELPDHLIHILPLLDRMGAAEAGRFASACVLPAVERMAAAFEGKANPYERILRAAAALVRRRTGAELAQSSGVGT